MFGKGGGGGRIELPSGFSIGWFLADNAEHFAQQAQKSRSLKKAAADVAMVRREGVEPAALGLKVPCSTS